jgi:type VI secretion system protein ImpI
MMELVFDVVGAQQYVPGLITSKSFSQAGGVIGRAEQCDWVIPDSKRVLSGQHARVSYQNGSFYLTDTSSNGIRFKDTGANLDKGKAHRIKHGSVYSLGDFEIRARLIQDSLQYEGDVGRPVPAGSIIPDDAFLDLDPLQALEQPAPPAYLELDDLAQLSRPQQPATQHPDYARIDMESLPLPTLVMPSPAKEAPVPAAPEHLSDGFWQRYSEALGIDLSGINGEQREALVLRTAKLLKQSVGHLQQNLHTRSELKNELRLALTTVQSAGNNPIKHSADSREALTALLREGKPGQLPAEHAVSRAFRDLQAHQVALLAASRSAVKSMFEHLSPEQLALRFEREHKPVLATAGGRWRAYRRWHQAMQRDNDWSERLFARDFAKAYEEQVRLIATLSTEH